MMQHFSTWKAIGNFLLNKEMWCVLGGIVKASFYLGFTKILAWCGVSGKKIWSQTTCGVVRSRQGSGRRKEHDNITVKYIFPDDIKIWESTYSQRPASVLLFPLHGEADFWVESPIWQKIC